MFAFLITELHSPILFEYFLIVKFAINDYWKQSSSESDSKILLSKIMEMEENMM